METCCSVSSSGRWPRHPHGLPDPDTVSESPDMVDRESPPQPVITPVEPEPFDASDLPIPTLEIERLPARTSHEFAMVLSFGPVAFFEDVSPMRPGFAVRGGWGKNAGPNARFGVSGHASIEGEPGVHTLLTLEPGLAFDLVTQNGFAFGLTGGPSFVHTRNIYASNDFGLVPYAAVRVGGSQTFSSVGRRMFVYFEPKVRWTPEGPVPIAGLVVGSGRRPIDRLSPLHDGSREGWRHPLTASRAEARQDPCRKDEACYVRRRLENGGGLMNRSMLAILAIIGLGACSDPEVNEKLTKLEERVEKLEQSPRAAARPGQADPASEQAAAELLKAATTAAEGMDVDTAKAKLAELSEKYGTTRAARAAQRLSTELEVVGKEAADLEVEKWFQGSKADVDGSKATLYVFWEVWCPHCKREVPKLTGTYDKYKGKGLSMVGLTKMTRNITEADVEDFIKANNVDYPIAQEKGDNLSRHYGVRGIPAAAMVKDGKVVWRGHPARLTDDMIDKYLGA